MNVRRITLDNFMCACKATVELPERGLVTIQGGNGEGKSRIVEAVSVAMFGKTLRGTSPWREDEVGSVEVETDLAMATRERSAAGRTTLSWHLPNTDVTAWETSTKAQEALEAVVGPWETWRRTSVFSSSDAAHFTTATDVERKRLLEALLGLDKFDVALERCRTKLKTAVNEAAAQRQYAAVQAVRVEAARKALSMAEALAAESKAGGNYEELEREALENAAAVESCEGDIAGLRDRLRLAERQGTAQEAKAAESERAARRLDSGRCPTCGQPSLDVAKKLLHEVTTLRAEAKDLRSAAELEVSQLRDDIRDLEREQSTFISNRSRLRAEADVAKRAEATVARAEQSRREATRELEEAEQLAGTLLHSLNIVEEEAATLEACEQVLGTRGLRAVVLSQALSGLEAAANVWLSKIAGHGMSLRLTDQVERKSGTTVDVIGLEVEGAGGGQGYRGASGGQRRRIDVALLFALAEVAAAASGRPPGTLLADECFDALDEDGVAAVAEALAEVARDRCVVVITHRDDLAAALPSTFRLRVDAGTVVKLCR